MAVAAPADKRFRRAHVSPARRRSWLPRCSWRLVTRASLLVGVLVFGAFKLVELVLTAEALTIATISVSGNNRMSRGEVLALLDGLTGQSMITADLAGWRQKLLLSPWVADASIRRVLPGAVFVVISERQPLAIGRVGDQLFLIDQRGDIIDAYGPNYAEFDLPIIDGLGAVKGGELLVDKERAALAGRVLEAINARSDLAKRISQIDVSDTRDATLLLKGDSAYLRVGDERFVERLQSYIDLAPALRERIPDIDYVDLRFDERVYVRPQGSTQAVQAAGRTEGE